MMHQKLEHGRMRQAAAKAALALAVSALPMVSWINEAKGALRPEWRNLESAFSRSVPPSTKPKCEIKDNKILYTKRNGARVTIDQGFGSETPSSVSLIEDKVFAIAARFPLYGEADESQPVLFPVIEFVKQRVNIVVFRVVADVPAARPGRVAVKGEEVRVSFCAGYRIAKLYFDALV